MTGNGAAHDPNDTNAVEMYPNYYNYSKEPSPTGSITASSTGSQELGTRTSHVSGAGFNFGGVSTVDHSIECKSSEHGRKFDQNKLEYGLVPPIGFKAVVEILTLGAQKYDRDNWKHVPDGKRRYFDAAMRHLWDWKSGERFDEETSKNHLAHAICNLMFLLEKDLLTE